MGAKKNSQGEWTWSQVGRLASLQLGIVSRDQLRDLGLSDRGISDAAARGWLRPVFHGVFAVGHEHLTVHARMLAATMACGEGSVVSHGTAAWLLGMRDRRPKAIDVIAPVEAGRRIAGIRRCFVPPPVGREVWRRQGVPVTSPARTIVDCAGTLDAHGIGVLIEGAAVAGFLDVPAIDRILDGPPRRGTKRLLVAVAPWRRYRRGIKLRSRMEAKLLPLLTEAALPIPQTNAKLRLGDKVYEVASGGTRSWWWKPTAAASTTTRPRAPGTANATTRSRRRAIDCRGSAGRTSATVPGRRCARSPARSARRFRGEGLRRAGYRLCAWKLVAR